MHIAPCSFDSEGSQILEILNEAILNSTALYDYKPRTIESMVQWFKNKELGAYPVIGAFENEKLMGFASYGAFRNWPAYKYTVEHSVYVHKEHRGKGLSVLLMQALIEAAREQQYHVMVGAIDASNQISISLHQKLGFTSSGIIHQAGFKFGRWLDLAFYQLILETPSEPTDG
jgi:phosphinothricin acetyltransferase